MTRHRAWTAGWLLARWPVWYGTRCCLFAMFEARFPSSPQDGTTAVLYLLLFSLSCSFFPHHTSFKPTPSPRVYFLIFSRSESKNPYNQYTSKAVNLQSFFVFASQNKSDLHIHLLHFNSTFDKFPSFKQICKYENHSRFHHCRSRFGCYFSRCCRSRWLHFT